MIKKVTFKNKNGDTAAINILQGLYATRKGFIRAYKKIKGHWPGEDNDKVEVVHLVGTTDTGKKVAVATWPNTFYMDESNRRGTMEVVVIKTKDELQKFMPTDRHELMCLENCYSVLDHDEVAEEYATGEAWAENPKAYYRAYRKMCEERIAS